MGILMSVGLGKTKNGYPEITVVEKTPNGVRHHVIIRRSSGDLVCDTANDTDLNLFELARAELDWTPQSVLDALDDNVRSALAEVARLPACRRDRVLASLRTAS